MVACPIFQWIDLKILAGLWPVLDNVKGKGILNGQIMGGKRNNWFLIGLRKILMLSDKWNVLMHYCLFLAYSNFCRMVQKHSQCSQRGWVLDVALSLAICISFNKWVSPESWFPKLHVRFKGGMTHKGFPGGSLIKNPPVNAGDADLIPGWRRDHGQGNDNSLQYYCLENPMGRRAWWATVHRAAKSWTQIYVNLSESSWRAVNVQ